MMRISLLLLVILPFVTVGQTDPELHEMPPKWRKGQSVEFTSTAVVRMTVGDTLPINSTTRANGTLKVMEKSSTGYIIKFSCEQQEPVSVDLDLGIEGDSVKLMVDSVMRTINSIASVYADIPVQYLVSLEGEVLDVYEPQKLRLAFENATYTMMEKLLPDGDRIGFDKHRVDSLIDTRMSDFIQVAVNQMNVLFMGYLMVFPTSGTYREEMMFSDVQAPLMDNPEPIHGWLELKTVQATHEAIVGQVDYIYDPADFVKVFSKQGLASNIDVEQISMRETRTFHYNLQSGWVSRIIEKIDFDIGAVKGYTTTTTELDLIVR